eukprot:m.101655 g.101655  ORF g.101655 m.101655 type:complete len:130 (+) comp37138_c0_seq10:511-900(+)
MQPNNSNCTCMLSNAPPNGWEVNAKHVLLAEKEMVSKPKRRKVDRNEPGALHLNLAAVSASASVPVVMEGEIEEEEDEEVTIKIGNKTVCLTDVTDDMIEQMLKNESFTINCAQWKTIIEENRRLSSCK